MKRPQPHEHREELGSLPDLLAQLPGAGVGSAHFREPKTFGGQQRRAQSELQREFLLGTLGGVGQAS